MLKNECVFDKIRPGAFSNACCQVKIISLEAEEGDDFLAFCSKNALTVLDTITHQLQELARITLVQGSKKEISDFIEKETQASNYHLFSYGFWIYYPWKRTIVHLLPPKQFQLVRTNRNREKITSDEQLSLEKKRIGIIGLSVGHSVAITIAQEGVCGEIRIADFDKISLSNLNRLRTSLINLEQEKSIVTCREILEINPYMKVQIYENGINDETMESFFLENGRLDLIVEACDSLEIKMKTRIFAREQKIPVVMDTNDRGLIDIERFDHEHNRPLLHGFFPEIKPNALLNLSSTEKLELIYSLLGGRENLSVAMRNSIEQVGKNLISFPQLASEVHLGGALATHVARNILLGKKMLSGRYYVELSELIG